MVRHRQTLDALWQGLNQQPLNHAARIISEDIEQSPDWNEYDHHNILAALKPDFASPQGMQRYLLQQADPKAAFASVFTRAIERWMSAEHDSDYKESWHGFRDRISEALRQLLAQHNHQQQLLVVTSGGPISLLTQQLMEIPEHKFLNVNWVLANCGISRILNGRNGLRLSSLNDYTAFEATPELITYK